MTFDGFVSNGKPGYHRYSADPLVGDGHVSALLMAAWVGQRKSSWRFELINGVTDERLGNITPFAPASISHDASRTIKRELRLAVGSTDLAEIDPLTDRILPFMSIGGQEYQLGRFMFTGETRAVRSRGEEASESLLDEMHSVDTQISTGFAASGSCDAAMRRLTDGLLLPQGRIFEASPYPAAGGWSTGSQRGSILNTLSIQGDLETPWMDNTGIMRAIRTVSPETAVPALDFDQGYPVLAETPSATTNLLDAPNRFVVVGNGSAANAAELVGTYDVPPSAPHSIANRGFVQQDTRSAQVVTVAQANAMAKAWGTQSSIVEEVELSTPPDPRHDGYQVIRWRGLQWLEVAWQMQCEPGGDMTHVLRRSYV